MAAPAAHSEGPLATAGAMVPTKETNLQRRKRIQREQTFPFFDLPREVRNMVYAEMAESTQTVRTRGRRQHYTLADYGYPKARLINREFKVEYDEERQKHGRVIIHEASQRLGRIINSLVQLTHVAAFRYLPVRHVFIERIFWVYLQDSTFPQTVTLTGESLLTVFRTAAAFHAISGEPVRLASHPTRPLHQHQACSATWGGLCGRRRSSR